MKEPCVSPRNLLPVLRSKDTLIECSVMFGPVSVENCSGRPTTTVSLGPPYLWGIVRFVGRGTPLDSWGCRHETKNLRFYQDIGIVSGYQSEKQRQKERSTSLRPGFVSGGSGERNNPKFRQTDLLSTVFDGLFGLSTLRTGTHDPDLRKWSLSVMVLHLHPLPFITNQPQTSFLHYFF